ncbi:2'-5' RNA ligase family protein [uncultured Legionella sp.]|uniref:2'-5' RNA ligase family protein n=1 Tax=uncultured Legionella sp. TaxID=210934 RepID=UPI0026118AE3|nr:2'-5' RNA ligase family protein [uncultured Legionella sp.]
MNFIARLLIVILLPSVLYAKDINVYLRFDEPILYKSIKQFNDYLENKGIFSRYHLKPFLEHHPLHITLYLASYHESQLDKIKLRVAHMAEQSQRIEAKTTQIYLTLGNYVMLDLDMNSPHSDATRMLQKLSDVLTIQLSELRDFNAKIPDWAETIPVKKRAFLRYGSPNVFFEFSPHFTLMAKNFEDKEEERRFQKEMSQLIQDYDFPNLMVESASIGIGYVDNFGQVTEELCSYPLRAENSN